MSKIKRSYTLDLDVDNAIGILATKLEQSSSQLVGNILRNYEPLSKIILEIQMADDVPEYKTKKQKISV